MDYSIAYNGNQATVSLKGSLIFTDTPHFSVVLDDLQKDGIDKCVMDLRGLDHIDSSGLRMMLLVHDVCRDKGRALTFLVVAGFVYNTLLHFKFDTIVDIRT